MRKQILIPQLILILSLTLASCVGHADDGETLKPIDRTAWPTPKQLKAVLSGKLILKNLKMSRR